MAIKIIDKNKLKDEVDKKRVEREINILKNTFHYNIIKIYQVKETSNTICLIMEYAEGGELFRYIIEKGYLSEDESRNIFQQIIDAIDYFHQIGVCHRDLKPENILFDTEEKKRIKIIDFGLSNLYIPGNLCNDNNMSFDSRNNLLETPCGSPGYAPPEMIIGYKYDGLMTDIWSSGIVLYAMLCGCLPFDDYTEEKLYLKIIQGKFYYPPMIKISKEAKNLINSILVVNPKDRATIKDIKKNKWFLNNYKPNLGLFISICEIPVSDLIIKEMKNLGYDEKKIIKYIKNNNHNSITTIYYLLVKKKKKQGIETESDMISHTFHKYVEKINTQNQRENIKPISLKLFILNSKENASKSKNEKDIKKEKENNKYLKDKEKKCISNMIEENKIMEIKNKEILNNVKEFNNGSLNEKKNKTLSKEKNSGINNNKNVNFININNTNLLIKPYDNDKDKIKYYKKITQVSKSGNDGQVSIYKYRTKNRLIALNINRMKIAHLKNFINLHLHHTKKNKANSKNSKPKKVIKEIKFKFKNNKTMIGEPINQTKDFNLSLNNNDNKNNNTLTERSLYKKGNNNDKFIINFKIKIKKEKIFNQDINIGLRKLCLNKIKNSQLIRYKNNLKKESVKEYNNIIIKRHKKLDSKLKINKLLKDLKTSRTGNNRCALNSNSNSQSKSKSNTARYLTSNSSNSKSKTNSIKDKFKKLKFLRGNNSLKNKSRKSHLGNRFSNLTQEKISNLKYIKKSYTLRKDKNHLIKNKNDFIQNNITNVKRINSSKSKKVVISKHKININNNNYKLKNFKTSVEHKANKMKKGIKSKNYMNILINDSNSNNNLILRHNTHNNNVIENNINNSYNFYIDSKQNQSLNLFLLQKYNIKEEFLNKKNKVFETVKDNYMINIHNKRKIFRKMKLNYIKKKTKDKLGIHYILNKNKLKECNKYSILNCTSNTLDENRRDIYCYFPIYKLYSKNRINKIINKTKSNNNNIKKISKKKLRNSDLKLPINDLTNFQIVKSKTQREYKN